MRSHMPCGETLLNSTFEVLLPSRFDFIEMILNNFKGRRYTRFRESKVSRELYSWFKPEFRFAGCVLNVDVCPALLAREEVETESPNMKIGRASCRERV